MPIGDEEYVVAYLAEGQSDVLAVFSGKATTFRESLLVVHGWLQNWSTWAPGYCIAQIHAKLMRNIYVRPLVYAKNRMRQKLTLNTPTVSAFAYEEATQYFSMGVTIAQR